MIKCRWCGYEIYYEVVVRSWRHTETFDFRKNVEACEPDMQSTVAEPEPTGITVPENVVTVVDAWQQHHDLVKQFTQTWEIRSDLEVTALATNRSVRLRVGDWAFNFAEPDPEKFKPEPKITTRGIHTMRELGEAILAACDFVEKANPKWASHGTPSTIERVKDGT